MRLKKMLGGELSPGANSATIIKKKKIVTRQIATENGIDPAFLETLRNQKEEEIKAALAQKGIMEEVLIYM
jgi:hypothetical protein